MALPPTVKYLRAISQIISLLKEKKAGQSQKFNQIRLKNNFLN
jgi:hypothetical protein